MCASHCLCFVCAHRQLNFSEIERLNVLGQGKTAVVFRGLWKPFNTGAATGTPAEPAVTFEVAVKVFSYMRALPPPALIESFAAEIGIMSGLNHPNLVSIIGARHSLWTPLFDFVLGKH